MGRQKYKKNDTKNFLKTKIANNLFYSFISDFLCGPDGTRTRDPVRDRHVF